MFNKTLELLNRAQNYEIYKESDTTYEIRSKRAEVAAFIEKEKVTYYITDCYNSGIDCIEIDMKALKELQEFCELLKESK